MPGNGETRYEVETVSKYADSRSFTDEDKLETLAEAQQRILNGLRSIHEDGYLLCYEAVQFELLDQPAVPNRKPPHERSRSRNAVQHPDTAPHFVEHRTKHRESPDSDAEAEAVECRPSTTFATPDGLPTTPTGLHTSTTGLPTAPTGLPTTPTALATESVTKKPKKSRRSNTAPRVSKPDSAPQDSTGPSMTLQESPIEPAPLPGSTVATLGLVKTRATRGRDDIDSIGTVWDGRIEAQLNTLQRTRPNTNWNDPDEEWRKIYVKYAVQVRC